MNTAHHNLRSSVLGTATLALAVAVSACGAGDNSSQRPVTGGTSAGGKSAAAGSTANAGTGTKTGGVTGTGGTSGGTSGNTGGGAVVTTGGTATGTTGGTVSNAGKGSGGTTGTTGGTVSNAGKGSGGTTTTSGGTSGNTGGGTAVGGTTGTGGGATGGTGACSHGANVLSDFESGKGDLYPVPDSNTNGWWSSYKDPDNCGSSTLVPTPVSTKDAPVNAEALATSDPRYSDCNKYAMHSSINNCQTWSGFGAAMHPTAGSDMRTAVDFSGYDGISFWAKAGSGTQGPLYLELVSSTCVPSTAGGTATSTAIDQYNCHGKIISSVPTTWTQYFVPFYTTGPRWFPTAGTSSSGGSCAAGSFCEPPRLETNKFLAMQFANEDPFNQTPAIAPNYDIWIDDVALYKFSDAPADSGLKTWTQSGTNTFPKDQDFSPNCTKPAGATGKLIRDAYVTWKEKFVTAADGGLKVVSPEIDSGATVSEGIGYGLIIAVYMADKPLFDGLLTYWKAHRWNNTMLMQWKIPGGDGSATDADEDTAFALQMARKQWGSAYDTDAAQILTDFVTSDVSGSYIKSGSNFSGPDPMNLSYFAPAFYRYFATVDTARASTWNGLVTSGYSMMAASAVGANGLVPAWCTSNCTSRGGGGYTDADMYQYDSHRAPWRIGLDQCWNGSSASGAQTYLNKVIGFFAGASDTEGLSSLADIYNGSGQPASGYAYNSMSLVGCAGVGAMGSTATGAAAFRDRVWPYILGGLYTENPTFKTGTSAVKAGYTYYNATVGLLTAMTMSGNIYLM